MERHSILIVDDEPNIRSSLTRLFHKEGYDILLAENSEDAFHILEKHTISVVLSDYLMPGQTGVEFLENVKKKYPEAVRIVLSGRADMNAIMNAVNQNVVSHFLLKPWDSDVLRSTIRNAIKGYEQKCKHLHAARTDGSESIEQAFPGILEIEETTSGAIIIDS